MNIRWTSYTFLVLEIKSIRISVFVRNKEFLADIENSKFDIAFTHMYNFCPIGIIHQTSEKFLLVRSSHESRRWFIPVTKRRYGQTLDDHTAVLFFWSFRDSHVGMAQLWRSHGQCGQSDGRSSSSFLLHSSVYHFDRTQKYFLKKSIAKVILVIVCIQWNQFQLWWWTLETNSPLSRE